MLIGSEKRKKLLVFLYRLNPLWRLLSDLEKCLPDKRCVVELLKENPFEGQRYSLPERTPERRDQAARRAREAAQLGEKGLDKSAGPREHLLKLSHETIRRWRTNDFDGEPQKHPTALAHLCHVLKLMESALPAPYHQDECGDLRLMVEEFARTLGDESADVYAAGRILGMDMHATQKAIDSVIHGVSPLLALAYYPSIVHAETDLIEEELGGLYDLWIRRGDFWMQCSIQIRYAFTVADRPIVRSKLHVPNLVHDDAKDGRTKGSHWEYDGFVRVLESKAYWVFEKRTPSRADFMFFVSARSNAKYRQRALYVGEYLTLGQDKDQSTASGIAIFNRLEGLPDTDQAAHDQRKRMEDAPRVLSSDHEHNEFLSQFLG
jgi:hypothetical protein